MTERATRSISSFTRAEQDDLAAQSHQRLLRHEKDGVYAEEVVPVKIPQPGGDPLDSTQDEGSRANTTGESLGWIEARLPQRRHDHRRFRVADLRRRCGGGGEQGQGAGWV
ncbi:hypothetical protein AAHS21_15055 [Mycobacterium sp. 050272]|uniref:thiolase family protein n=1 Tax=Mycobacterium sp. 050272 TaxID=3142488 RepID=UPI00319311B1